MEQVRAHYRLREGGGQRFHEEQGRAPHALLTSGPTWKPGACGAGVRFTNDGTAKVSNAAWLNIRGPLTLWMLFEPRDAETMQWIQRSPDSTDWQWFLGYTAGQKLTAGVQGNAGTYTTVTGATTLALSKLYLGIFTYDLAQMRLWVGEYATGRLYQDGSQAKTQLAVDTPNNNLYLGGNGPASQLADGILYEAGIAAWAYQLPTLEQIFLRGRGREAPRRRRFAAAPAAPTADAVPQCWSSYRRRR